MSSSSSPSEGEIVEHRSKALPPVQISRNNSVDRQFRPSPSVSPKAPELGRNYRDRSRSPFRHKRDRSRSPFRHGRDRSPRGEKRRRENDDSRGRLDNRHHRARFDTSRPEYRKPASYKDPDRLGHRTSSYRDLDRPSNHEVISYDEIDRHGAAVTSAQLRGGKGNRRPGEQQSHNHSQYQKSKLPEVHSQQGFNNTRLGVNFRSSREQLADNLGVSSITVPEEKMSSIKEVNDTNSVIDHSQHQASTVSSHLVAVVEHEPRVSEDDATIEAIRAEKKRKREEIRARHATANPSLLQQVLVGNITEPGTPTAITPGTSSERSVSPSLPTETASPQSVSDSPDGLFGGDAGDDAAQSPQEEDEPSAADYNPTFEMEQERLRATLQQNHPDLSASTHSENATKFRDATLQAAPRQDHVPKRKAKKEIDMFASDDDMSDEDNEVNGVNGADVPDVSHGRQLDENLLDSWEDDQGYLRIFPGELIGNNNRYEVKQVLGKGVFAVVVRAFDHLNQELVAIKIVRKNELMREAGTKEIKFLKKILENDPEDKRHVVRFKNTFDHKGHLCMVFENLEMNLRDLLKSVGRNKGIGLSAVKSYARQMFHALALLRKCNILHADLKPDNILVDESHKNIKICDLGSAVDIRDNHDITPYLVSRFYRAPDLILGTKLDFGIDMWAIGCTLYELWTGKILFTGATNNQMLKSIMEVRGKFSTKYLKKGALAPQHFDDSLTVFHSLEKDPFNKIVTRPLKVIKQARDIKTRVLDAAQGFENAPTKVELQGFADLLEKCLNPNFEKRITPKDALDHPFLAVKNGSTMNASSLASKQTVKPVAKPGFRRYPY